MSMAQKTANHSEVVSNKKARAFRLGGALGVRANLLRGKIEIGP
jgi:predicted hotdog family 3-hydroxylacyl-ACP dehydratase